MRPLINHSFLVFLMSVYFGILYGQDPSAIFELDGTDQGILIPRTDTATINASYTPATGLLMFQNSDSKFYVYTGSKWESLASAGGGNDDQTLAEVLTQGNDANSFVISNLSDPVSNQDAATKKYVDDLWVLSGGVMNNNNTDDIDIDNGTLSVDVSTNSVGIGTTTPSSNLNVEGNAAEIEISNSTESHGGILFNDRDNKGSEYAQIHFNSGSNNNFNFYNGTTTASLTLDPSDGTVGIGTLSPDYQLELSTNSAAKPLSSTWTVASDQRLKTEIEPFTDGLGVVRQIKPIWFRYNGQADMPTNERGVGTLAQELQIIAPYMVHEWISEDDNGNKDSYLAVDYGAMDFVLVNAIRQQQEVIDSLQSQIDKLESSNQDLTDQLKSMFARLDKIENGN